MGFRQPGEDDLLTAIGKLIAREPTAFLLGDKPRPVLKMLKGIAYSQAVMGFGLLIKNIETPTIILAGIALTFPVLLIIGIILGLMEDFESDNYKLVLIIIPALVLSTTVNLISVFAFVFERSTLIGFSLLIGMIILIALSIVAVKFYSLLGKAFD